MKDIVRWVFRPILNLLEAEGEGFVYRKSHRMILIITSCLFLFLASLSLYLAPSVDYLFAVLIFGGAGLLGLVVGAVGKDVAVARLWGSR